MTPTIGDPMHDTFAYIAGGLIGFFAAAFLLVEIFTDWTTTLPHRRKKTNR